MIRLPTPSTGARVTRCRCSTRNIRPGDNLYTNSTIALDADTGALKWHFQYTPGDYMDYDEVGIQLLMDAKVNGEDRKVLAHFGRNGIFYSLDRTNGSYIQSAQYVEAELDEGHRPQDRQAGGV
jgi:alcohol dehydrogenase (cytochrome c)